MPRRWKRIPFLKRIKRKIRKNLLAKHSVEFRDPYFEKAVLMSTEHKSDYYITHLEAEQCTNVIASIFTRYLV